MKHYRSHSYMEGFAEAARRFKEEQEGVTNEEKERIYSEGFKAGVRHAEAMAEQRVLDYQEENRKLIRGLLNGE